MTQLNLFTPEEVMLQELNRNIPNMLASREPLVQLLQYKAFLKTVKDAVRERAEELGVVETKPQTGIVWRDNSLQEDIKQFLREKGTYNTFYSATSRDDFMTLVSNQEAKEEALAFVANLPAEYYQGAYKAASKLFTEADKAIKNLRAMNPEVDKYNEKLEYHKPTTFDRVSSMAKLYDYLKGENYPHLDEAFKREQGSKFVRIFSQEEVQSYLSPDISF